MQGLQADLPPPPPRHREGGPSWFSCPQVTPFSAAVATHADLFSIIRIQMKAISWAPQRTPYVQAATRMLFRRCSLVCRPRKPISALSPKTCRLPCEPGYHDFSLDFLEGVPDFDGRKGGPEAGNLYSTPGRRSLVSLPSRASFDCTWATSLARGARLPIACLWRRLICS